MSTRRDWCRSLVLRWLCSIAALVLLTGAVLAQGATEPVAARWEPGTAPETGWTVGDPIPLRLQVTHPPELSVVLPELPVQWGAFEVQEQLLLEPVEHDDGTVNSVREAMVVLWAPGEQQTPDFAVRYRGADGMLHEVDVPPVTVTVGSVLTEEDIEKADLKAQAALERPPLWPWILAGTCLTVALALAARWLWRRLQGRQVLGQGFAAATDNRPPDEIAYGELDRIAALDLPAAGEFKWHYTLVTNCVRRYVEGLYGIPATERTTLELMWAIGQAGLVGKSRGLMLELLDEADLVKFAKLRPSIQEAWEAVAQGRQFVDLTRPKRDEPEDIVDPTTEPVRS